MVKLPNQMMFIDSLTIWRRDRGDWGDSRVTAENSMECSFALWPEIAGVLWVTLFLVWGAGEGSTTGVIWCYLSLFIIIYHYLSLFIYCFCNSQTLFVAHLPEPRHDVSARSLSNSSGVRDTRDFWALLASFFHLYYVVYVVLSFDLLFVIKMLHKCAKHLTSSRSWCHCYSSLWMWILSAEMKVND